MCTVTFLPRRQGFCLGMNRDEKLTRRAGLAPTLKRISGRKVLCPSEPGGGTWVGVNESGAALALINWYSVAACVAHDPVSRGEIVRTACPAISPQAVEKILAEMPLNRMNPFRLIGVFPDIREIAEWRWNLKQLVRKAHPWQAQQWISSGFDEPTAQRIRDRTFRQAMRQTSAGSLDWLRRLHRSHGPEPGPFSTCMHRADAATVSCTEVSVAGTGVVMRYHPGPPCQSVSRWVERRIPR